MPKVLSMSRATQHVIAKLQGFYEERSYFRNLIFDGTKKACALRWLKHFDLVTTQRSLNQSFALRMRATSDLRNTKNHAQQFRCSRHMIETTTSTEKFKVCRPKNADQKLPGIRMPWRDDRLSRCTR